MYKKEKNKNILKNNFNLLSKVISNNTFIKKNKFK